MKNKEELQKSLDKLGVVLEKIINDYMLTPTEINKIKKQYKTIQKLIDQQSQSTLDDCIKEWKKRGWTYHKSEDYNWFFVKKEYKEICFDCDKINYESESFFEIDLELNVLIGKTLKAMEKMKDE